MSSDDLPNLVRIVRVDDLDPVICHIHQSSTDSVIASELSDSLDLDGFCILPTRTVRYFDRSFDKAEFYRAALDAWGTMDDSERSSGLSCSMVSDLELLACRGSIIAVHMESDDPDVCFIGIPREVKPAGFLLDMISPRGLRISAPMEVKMDEVTKVEIATRYLRATGHAAKLLDRDE